MGSTRTVLFIFHDRFDLLAARVELLRTLNPACEVYGLFGGPSFRRPVSRAAVSTDLADVYCSDRMPEWNKKNTDLAVRDWHLAVGRSVPFDVLHVIQWDLLLFDSLDRLYAGLTSTAVGLNGLVPLRDIADRWYWTTTPRHVDEWKALLEHARARYGYRATPMACLGPAYCLPRAFLERFCEASIPEVGHDELRLPLFAQLFGFDLADVGFYRKWFDPEEERFFNADATEIEPSLIEEELQRTSGHRAFHPCRERSTEVFVRACLATVTHARMRIDRTTASR